MSQDRTQLLNNWLESIAHRHALDLTSRSEASGDASARKYYRICLKHPDRQSAIIMDAPPDKENTTLFCHITDILAKAGVSVPLILEKNLQDGFLLLSDLGSHNYFQELHRSPSAAEIHGMYLRALDALIKLQTADASALTAYCANTQVQELQLFNEWFLNKLHGVFLNETEQQRVQDCFLELAQTNAEQPQVFVHRDFHSPNLMVDPKDCGVLDYQDAVRGPISYDIASLAQDARFTWDEPQQLDWCIRYWEKARAANLPVAEDFATFHQQYEWMALQRNLRILGVFARLHLRDQKSHYLLHIPRVLGYVKQVASHYDRFKILLRILDNLPEHTLY